MNRIGSSIKEQLDLVTVKHQQNVRGAFTFEKTGDFSPHHETFMGELPMVYSFEKVMNSLTGWVELKDGFFSLLPFLLKMEPSPEKLVLPDVARFFLPEGDFYYSRFQFEKKTIEKGQICYVLLDFYHGLTSQEKLEKSFTQLSGLASQFKEVKLCVSVSGIASKDPSLLFVLLNALKQLPGNVVIIGNEELYAIKNFRGSQVIILSDDDFVLKSPWENIFVSRGANIERPKIDENDKLILKVPIAPGVDKVVYQHAHTRSLTEPEVLEQYLSFVKLINNPQDLIRESALRHTRDFVKVVLRSIE